MRILILYVVICLFPLMTLAQNQKELPVLSLRYLTSWGPNFEDFNPSIAVYRDGFIILKQYTDSLGLTKRFKYFCSRIQTSAVDSLLLVLEPEFNTLKRGYDPWTAMDTLFSVTDAGAIIISIHNRINKSVSIRGSWVPNDTTFLYNPKPAKQIYDWLKHLSDSILSNKLYTSWTPSRIELTRIELTRNRRPNTKFGSQFNNRQWSELKDSSRTYRVDTLSIVSQEEINYIMSVLNNPMCSEQTIRFKRKLYRVFYTFGYDIIPYYHNHRKQFNSM